MATCIIVNPTAGAGRAGRRIASLRPLLRANWRDIDWVESRSADHVQELAAGAAAAGYDRVLVAGGDGTVHFAANGVAGTKTALGILPVGTGNDIAASVGMPRDPGAAARMLFSEAVHEVDVGQVGDRIYCCVLGIGMDTQALHVINGSRMRRGRFLYTWAALRTLFTYQPRRMTIATGQCSFEGDVLFAAITNTRTYAGGIPISPNARVDDGRLDLCIIPSMGLMGALEGFGRAMSGNHVSMRRVAYSQESLVTVTAQEPIPITLDGELTDLRTDITVKVLPRALRVLGSPRAGISERPLSAKPISRPPVRERAAGQAQLKA